MSKARNPWQRLAQFIAAHMHEPVPDDRLDRAVKIASGSLTSNPQFVEETFKVVAPEREILASAISKEGTAAWLFGKYTKPEGHTISLRLVTWKNGVRKEAQLPDYQTTEPKTFRATIWFPDGSTEPVVLVDGRYLRWVDPGGHVIERSFKDRVDDIHILLDESKTFWWLAWRIGGKVFMHYAVQTWPTSRIETPTSESCSWMGLVGGSPAMITLDGSANHPVETLHWRHIHHRMPHPGQTIVPETISPSSGGIQFVARRRKVPTVFWTDGTETKQLEVLNELPLLFDRGEIFSIQHSSTGLPQLMQFMVGRFEDFGLSVDSSFQSQPEGSTRLVIIGNTVILYKLQKVGVLETQCFGTPPRWDAVVGTHNVTNVGRFHNWLVLGKKDETFHFHFIEYGMVHPLKDAIYPLYDQPFDRLTEVEDERGKAVMSWAYTDGTLHVIRYPLPTR